MGETALNLLLLGVPAIIAVVVLVRRMRADLRRFGNALWLSAALLLVLAAGSVLGLPGFGGLAALAILLGVLSPLLTVFLVVACLANGIVMIRREGRSLGNVLSLLLGLAMVGLIVALVGSLIGGSRVLLAVSLFAMLAAGYFAFVFVSLVLYAFVYSVIVRRRLVHQPMAAVIVLGSGLKNGDEVTPLLRARIDEGLRTIAIASRFQHPPVLVMSGGKGSDEQISEAEAMSRYALDQGFAADNLVIEDRSTNTAENLRFSAELLAERARTAIAPASPQEAVLPAEAAFPANPTDTPAPAPRTGAASVVVTNSYHAFRAADEARKAGVDAQAIGCRTAPYFWLSATLREFVAFLREHKAAHAVMLVLFAVPVPLALILFEVVFPH